MKYTSLVCANNLWLLIKFQQNNQNLNRQNSKNMCVHMLFPAKEKFEHSWRTLSLTHVASLHKQSPQEQALPRQALMVCF